jgi:hypothetical protein
MPMGAAENCGRIHQQLGKQFELSNFRLSAIASMSKKEKCKANYNG